MDIAWLNRIGIILNFIAGFLLAPEIIGVSRLQKLEKSIEQYSNSQIASIEKYFSELFPSNFKLMVYLSLVVPFLLLLFIWTFYKISHQVSLSILIGLYLYLIFFYVFFGSSESTKVKKSTFKIKKTFLSNLWIAVKEERVDLFLAQPFYMFAFTNFISLLFIVTSISLILIRKPLSGIVKILDGKDRIQSILVIIGVIVFILGNFLQFIATFG